MAYGARRPVWEVVKFVLRLQDLERQANLAEFHQLARDLGIRRIVRTAVGTIRSNQPVRVSYGYEALRNRLATRERGPRPAWAELRTQRPTRVLRPRRPPYPWARCALPKKV